MAVLALLLPSPLWAEVCDKLAPHWDGTTRSALTQMMAFWTSIWALPLIALVALALWQRNRHLDRAAAALGVLIALALTRLSADQILTQARSEGCLGPIWALILTLLAPALLLIRRS